MVMHFCPHSGRETEHLNVSEAAINAPLTRRTVYNWPDRSLVHYVHCPGGRKLICNYSLVMSDKFKGSLPLDQVPTDKLFVCPHPSTAGKHS